MTFERSSGILMPIFSLPSPYGIGTLGQAAYDFVDFLVEAGQTYWQILPVGPTGYGDSPYQSFTSFGGNPYLIDPDLLVKDGLLLPGEAEAFDWGSDPEHIDYGKMYENRTKLLELAVKRGLKRDEIALIQFIRENATWLLDYALYMAVKKHFGMKCFQNWPDEDIRLHKPEAVKEYMELLKDDVAYYEYVQFLFFKQWRAFRIYCKEKGIKLIGDLPIYVSMDSADIWASPESFQLDSDNRPVWVAGVPPDYFNEDGQLWGNPLYDWDAMKKDGYGWWIRRLAASIKLYDVVRLDHFRGFESYWRIPATSVTAKKGEWVKGPGIGFITMITQWFYGTGFIAEDLGDLTDDVRKMVDDSGLPGMKVLEFAFDPEKPSLYLPHNIPKNSICYAGTHDNAPALLWAKEETPERLQIAREYIGLNDVEGAAWGLLRAGMTSQAVLFVGQMQDYLELCEGSRINTPGVGYGNWCWRMKEGAADSALAKKIRHLTEITERVKKVPKKTAAAKTVDEEASGETVSTEKISAEDADVKEKEED